MEVRLSANIFRNSMSMMQLESDSSPRIAQRAIFFLTRRPDGLYTMCRIYHQRSIEQLNLEFYPILKSFEQVSYE